MSSRRGLISPQLRSAIPVLHFLHGLLKVCFLPLILPICIPLLLHYYYYYLRQNAEKWETVRRKWERDSWLIHRFFTSCAKSMWKAFVTGSAFSEWKKKKEEKLVSCRMCCCTPDMILWGKKVIRFFAWKTEEILAHWSRVVLSPNGPWFEKGLAFWYIAHMLKLLSYDNTWSTNYYQIIKRK